MKNKRFFSISKNSEFIPKLVNGMAEVKELPATSGSRALYYWVGHGDQVYRIW